MARTQVQSELIATNAISGTIIADNAITATHIATNSISGTLVQDSGIVTSMIAANNVTSAKIVTDAVLTRHIANDQVTGDKLTNNITIAGTLTSTGAFTSPGIDDNADATAITINSNERVMIGTTTEGRVNEGADMFIGETFYYAEEAFKALEIMKQAKLPTVVTIAPMAEDIMRDGYGIVETCKELEQRGADVVGMNCFRGPATMLPYLKEIRKKVKCHVGALPIPVRTNKKYTTWFNLPDRKDCTCPAPHGRTFPTALEPLLCNRYEIGQFAKDAHKLGINYLGVCCLGNPVLVREVAHAVGVTVPASKYREKMENHFMYGKNIPKHMKNYGNKA